MHSEIAATSTTAKYSRGFRCYRRYWRCWRRCRYCCCCHCCRCCCFCYCCCRCRCRRCYRWPTSCPPLSRFVLMPLMRRPPVLVLALSRPPRVLTGRALPVHWRTRTALTFATDISWRGCGYGLWRVLGSTYKCCQRTDNCTNKDRARHCAPCEALLFRVLQQELVSHMRSWPSWSFLLQHTTREFSPIGSGGRILTFCKL